MMTQAGCTFLAALYTVLALFLPGRVYLKPVARDGAVCSSGAYTLVYDTSRGTFSAEKDGVTLFADAFCEYDRDGKIVSSRDYTSFSAETRSDDGGQILTIRMEGEGLWALTQTFALRDDAAWFTTRVTLSGGDAATNMISPLVVTDRKLQNFLYKWTRVLEVPFDNDGWAEFHAKAIDRDTVSYEVGALFTPDDGSGLILGSLEHDLWKSSVETTGKLTKLDTLRVRCGAVDPRQGTEPHGTVRGERVDSALIFIGVYDNWKDGMIEFARANTAITPKRQAVTEAVPFGWNSWGSVQSDLSYDIAVGTSDYIRDRLQPVWQADGAPVWVNLDSWWDRLSDDELRAFVEHCHANGQKAGIYSAPFVMWWDDYGMSISKVPGTDGTVTYQDIRLKKHDGSYYGNEVDGCLPLDVTHPATKKHVEHQINRFKTAGFDYIKLDFLVHASFEGDFYDDRIQTGIEAYNYAMTYLTELIGDDMFINLAMSPTFPYCYANGRRLACDAYYGIGDTEYTLNAVTYGFWERELYDFTDPDHIVVWGREGRATENEARSRATSGVIAGTSFLAGDNFVSPAGNASEAFARYEKLLANPDVIAVAKTGRMFTPVITNVLNRTANIYRLELEDRTYIAVFNFSAVPAVFTVRTGLKACTARELWSGKSKNAGSVMSVLLAGRDAALFEITERTIS